MIIEHAFLSLDPRVFLVSFSNEDNTPVIKFQIIMTGADRISVIFDFYADTDTAEQIVNEMVSTLVLIINSLIGIRLMNSSFLKSINILLSVKLIPF